MNWRDKVMSKEINFNKLFGFFLNKKGITPKFKKTRYGYRTYDSRWKLFSKSLSITCMKSVKVYNGYDYDRSFEETKYKIEQVTNAINVYFVYRKII